MAWTKTTEEVGTCSTLGSTETTETTCDIFNGSTWSFTNNRVVITMTLTETLGDTENTDLSNLDEVTYELVGTTHTYTFDSDTRLQVEGTLNINTERSKIVMLREVVAILQPSILIVEGTAGIVNFGVEKIAGSGIYTDGVGMEFAGGSKVGGGGYLNLTVGQHLSIDGTFTINGGRVKGPFSWSLTTDGEIAGSYPSKFLVYDNQSTAWLSKLRLGTISATGLTMEGGAMVLSSDGGRGTYSINRVAGDVGYQNEGNTAISDTGATNTYAIIKDISFEANTVDYGCYSIDHSGAVINPGNGAKLQNIAQGSAVNVNGALTAGAIDRNSNVYVLGTQRITSDLMSLADGSAQTGIILMRDTNRFANLTVDVEGGTQKTPLSTSRSEFDDNSQFTYRGDVLNGVIDNWSPLGGYGAGKLVSLGGETEIVLWTYSSTLIDGVNRPRDNNNEGIWARDIRGATDDITAATLDQFDFHIWSYENNYVRHRAVVAGVEDYTIMEALTVDPAVTLSRAAAVALEESSKGDALTYTTAQINLTAALTLDELYDIIKMRKELDVSDENLPSLSTMIISGDGEEIDLSAMTNNFTGSGVLSAGTNHRKVTHDTELSLDDFTLAGLEVSASALTLSGSSLTVPAGCKLTGTLTKNSATTITVEDDGDVSGLILAGTGTFTLVGVTDSDISSSTATTINAFTHSVIIDTSAVSETTFYRVLTGSTLATLSDSDTFGSVTGATNSHTIALDSTSITSLSLGGAVVVVATSADGLDVRHVTTLQDTTDNITINKNLSYNSAATAVSGDVIISLDSPITEMTLTLKAGISLGSADTNKSINSVRSSQNYCDFIAFVGTDGSIVNPSQNSTDLHADTTILATVADGSTISDPVVQGLNVDSGKISDILSPATFTTTEQVSIGMRVTPDNAVDYAAVRSTVKNVVEEPLKKASRFIPLNDSDF